MYIVQPNQIIEYITTVIMLFFSFLCIHCYSNILGQKIKIFLTQLVENKRKIKSQVIISC